MRNRRLHVAKRGWSIFAAIVLATSALVALAPSASASAKCHVKNATTMHVYDGSGANLQTAIDASTTGTTIVIFGVCSGNFSIEKDLTLVGRSNTAFPTPSLDGEAAGTVLTITTGSVGLKDLTVTNGATTDGGGIYNQGGSITLSGSTSVTGNTASSFGGGIFNISTVIMRDLASVSGNTAGTSGGGIFNYNGDLVLKGAASVSANSSAGDAGGIIVREGSATLRDAAVVSGNTAFSSAGGVFVFFGALVLRDSASITGNTAGSAGGGVYKLHANSRLFKACTTWTGAISPNNPDDAPTPTPKAC